MVDRFSSLGRQSPADSSGKLIHVHHKVNLALLALAPVAVACSPSMINMPIDLALGLALPLHAHIGMNMVATDYVSKLFGKGAVAPARYGLVAFTVRRRRRHRAAALACLCAPPRRAANGAAPLSRARRRSPQGLTVLGLLKLNLTGPGITETVKGFWRPKAE